MKNGKWAGDQNEPGPILHSPFSIFQSVQRPYFRSAGCSFVIVTGVYSTRDVPSP
jgi:hypothetical protein